MSYYLIFFDIKCRSKYSLHVLIVHQALQEKIAPSYVIVNAIDMCCKHKPLHELSDFM